jgi:multiple sugar transport system permease protein
LAAFKQELAAQAAMAPGRTVGSIFFGGGTPSLMQPSTVGAILDIIAGLWPQTAYCMILYLTGLNSVNPEMIEAARLDGAKGWRLLVRIVLPQLRAATFIALVVTVIGALRSFDLVAVMTSGGPYNSSNVLAYYMYDNAISRYRMGYASAIATILFLIMDVYIAWFLMRLLRNEKGVR